MRILHLVRQFSPSIGGLETYVACLAEAQGAAGHQVTVVTLDRVFAAPKMRLPAEEERPLYRILRIPYRGSTRYPLAPGFLGHLAEADIIHVHAIDFFFDMAALARLWQRKPMVVSTHGGFFHTGRSRRLKQVYFNTVTRLSLRAYILLLDDDNILGKDCLSALTSAYTRAADDSPTLLTVVGFRPDHLAHLAQAIVSGRAVRSDSSFRSFHLFDIPRKIAWRLRPTPACPSLAPGQTIALSCAPYGGMLFHRSLIDRIGLPKEDFVLYGDDIEFSARISLAGGRLLLVPDAPIRDAEASWQVAAAPATGFSFTVWLNGASDLRAFYTFRNGAFWDRYRPGTNRPLFWLNLTSLMTLLAIAAVVQGRYARFGLLLRACRDGLAKRLGEDAKFKLVQ